MNANVNAQAQIKRVAQISRNDQMNRIAVYSFDDENIAGLFSNNLYGKELPFGNLMTMLLMIENCMNSISWPQQMSDHRKLLNLSQIKSRKKSSRGNIIRLPEMTSPPDWETEKPLATFGLQILFRTVSGWQGVVHCYETGHSKKFISDLELITFMISELRRKS